MSVDRIPSSTPRSDDPKPNPAEMFERDGDAIPMIDASFNARDAALIAVTLDPGGPSLRRWLQDRRFQAVSGHQTGGTGDRRESTDHGAVRTPISPDTVGTRTG